MKINQLKVGAILSYVSMILGYLVSIIYTPVMLKLLGQSEYGLYNLVASVVAYLGVLNFGFGSAYMRYYSKYKVNEDNTNISRLNGMFLIIFSFLGLIAVIAGFLMAFNTKIIFGSELSAIELSRTKILMLILVINLAFSFPSIVFTAYISANEKFIFQKVVQMIKVVASPFIVLPLLILGYGSVGMVLATTILSVIIEFTNALFCIKVLKMKFSFDSFDFNLMKEMSVFSSYIFIHMIVDQINWNVDKFILGRYKGTDEVAIYSVGAQLNSYLISISAVISTVFIPRINNIVAKKFKDNELTKLFIKIGRLQYIFVTLVVTSFIIFGQSFINLWAGSLYYESYKVAVLLMLPMMIDLIQNIGIEIRKAQNKHKIPALFMLFIALLNITITIPLAKKYGAVGSAFGTSLAILVNQLFMNVYYQRVLMLDIKLFWKEIFTLSKGIILPVLIGGVLIVYRKNLSDMSFLLLVIPYILVYIFSFYRFGLNNLEKNMLIHPRIKNIFNKKMYD